MANWNIENITILVANSKSKNEVIRKLGLIIGGGYNRKLREMIKKHNLDISHFTLERKITREEIEIAIKTSETKKHVMQKLNLVVNGANHRKLRKWIKEYNIDTSHFTGIRFTAGKPNLRRLIPTEKILIENSSYLSTNNLKKRLLKEKLLIYKCYECGINTWRGKPLTLQLHHINGIPSDNRLFNLTLLCANCHSQTSNYCNGGGRSKHEAS